MEAKKLRLVAHDSIELDEPEQGLENTLRSIADDLAEVGQVRGEVKRWALKGSLLTTLLTVGATAAVMVVLRPVSPAQPALVEPPTVAVVIPKSPASERLTSEAPAATVPVLASMPSSGPAPEAYTELGAAAAPAGEAISEGPASDAELSVRRALRALWANRPRAALREVEGVLSTQPGHVDALAAKAFALFDLRKDRAARATVRQALKLDPKHPLANVLRGTMAQVDHDHGSALAHYDKYLRVRPHGALASELHSVRDTLSSQP